MYNQRDIVIIPFPFDDLTGVKQRPALIISNNTISEHKICCSITSRASPDGILINNHFEQGSLPKQSWTRPHKLFTVHERVIKKKLGSVSSSYHAQVIERIRQNTVAEKK